jgi:hypothetical protein
LRPRIFSENRIRQREELQDGVRQESVLKFVVGAARGFLIDLEKLPARMPADEAEFHLQRIDLLPVLAVPGLVLAAGGQLGADEIRELILGVHRVLGDPSQHALLLIQVRRTFVLRPQRRSQ